MEATRTDVTATVTVDVAATFQAPGNLGLFATTEPRLWTFQVDHMTGIDGSGWKVTRMDSPEICDVYLDC
jgi:hypothetical protein